MDLSRNHLVAARFARAAHTYERYGGLQRDVAAKLADFLPRLDRPRILEVGCGTGFLTGHLLSRYAHGDFLVTDLAPEMVEQCRSRHQSRNGRSILFDTMDGEAPVCAGSFDLVALSMTLQWFTDPLAGLRGLTQLLKPGGRLLYAAPGQGSLAEWQAVLEKCGLARGGVEMPDLPHIMELEELTVRYESGVAFLQTLKGIGATTPRPGYLPLPAGRLRKALQRFEDEYDARATWRIVYGQISA